MAHLEALQVTSADLATSYAGRNRRHTCRALAGIAGMAALAGCSGGSSSTPPLAPTSTVFAAELHDVNQSGRLDAGDIMAVRFDQPVKLASSSTNAFALPIPEDTFGVGAALQAGPTSDVVHVVLGTDPVLTAAGAFATGSSVANVVKESPSGVAVGPAGPGSILDFKNRVLRPSEPQDVRVGLLPGPVLVSTAGSAALTAALADFDRDGRLDIAIGRPERVEIWYGDGNAQFELRAQAGQTLDVEGLADVVALDTGRDGRTDLVASLTASLQPIQNVAAPPPSSFMPSGGIASPQPRQLVRGDFNDDGKDDLACAEPTDVRIWRGDGAGSFELSQVLPASVLSLSAGDLDRDGKSDLVAIATNGVLVAFGGNLPAGFVLYRPAIGLRGPATLGDIDGDGDPDVIAVQASTDATQPDSVVWFPTGGTTAQPRVAFRENANSLAAFDANGDGTIDVATGSASLVAIWANPGRLGGPFALEASATLGGATGRISIGDLDGDGDPDLVTCGSYGCRAVTQNAPRVPRPPRFVRAATNLAITDCRTLAVADFNADGLLDLYQGDNGFGGGAPDVLYHFDAATRMAVVVQMIGAETSAGADVLDYDGDGDQDVVLAADSASSVVARRIMLLRNDGGALQPTPLAEGLDVHSVAVADANRDGREDFFFCALQYGIGRAPAYGLVSFGSQDDAFSLTTADFDGDGWTDFSGGIGNAVSRPLRCFLSRNGGNDFDEINLNETQPIGGTIQVASADLDGDGDVDLVVGNEGASGTSPTSLSVWYNAGNATFPDQVTLSQGLVHRVRVGDFDRDGRIDLLAVIGNEVRLFRNTGPRAFELVATPFPSGVYGDLAVADFDRDGVQDVVLGRRDGPSQMWFGVR